MANVIGVDHPKFQDRGYIFRKPTQEECKEMGWHAWWIIYDNGDRHLAKIGNWISETVWWQDYVLFPYGIVYFKHERDLLLCKLRWA